MNYEHDVCFVGLKCFDLLRRAEIPRYLGGIERVLVTLARGLAQSGQKVAFITYDEGQDDDLTLDGITIIKAYDPNAGVRGVRYIHPRMTSVWQAMKKANAKAYVQMGAGDETGVVCLGAKYLNRSKFIFCIASDANCDATLPTLKSGRERLLYRWGLNTADVVVSQTNIQAQRLEADFGVKSIVIPMPFQQDKSLVAELEGVTADASERPAVLWVGRVVEVKRLNLYLDLAEAMGHIDFHIVGASNAKTEYAKNLVARAKSIPNVVVHGKIPDVELLGLYRRSTLLCCTSSLEGFPTTFLEAWSFKKPVLTTFDPDGVVHKNELGVVCVDSELQKSLEQLLENKPRYDELTENSFQFYQQNYTVEAIAPKYINLVSKG